MEELLNVYIPLSNSISYGVFSRKLTYEILPKKGIPSHISSETTLYYIPILRVA